MSGKWFYIALTFVILSSTQVFAAKPQQPPAAQASEVFSVLVDTTTSEILVKGNNLASVSAATLAGQTLPLTGAPTSSDAVFSFGLDVTNAVTTKGNYVLKLTTDGGDISLSVYIPYALYPAPPPSELCPCYGEWESFRTSSPPSGFDGVALTCYIDDPTYTYVYIEDATNSLGWILRTEWIDEIGLGYCEAFLDGPQRTIFTQDIQASCATYLRDNIISIYPGSPICQ